MSNAYPAANAPADATTDRAADAYRRAARGAYDVYVAAGRSYDAWEAYRVATFAARATFVRHARPGVRCPWESPNA